MKYVFLAVLLSNFWVDAISQLHYSHFQFTPDQPAGGQVIKLSYQQDFSRLPVSAGLFAIAYLNGEIKVPREGDFSKAVEIPLQLSEGIWSGEITTSSTTRSIMVVLMDSLGNVDNNEGQGYWLAIYKGGVPVPGAMGSLAEMYAGGWSPEHCYHLERKLDLARQFYEEEFGRNPALKPQYARFYFATLNLLNPDDRALFKQELDHYAHRDDLTEWDLLYGVSGNYQKLGDSVRAKQYERLVFEKFPRGSWAIQNQSLPLIEASYLTTDYQKRQDIYWQFKQTYCQQFPDEFTRRIMNMRQGQLLAKVLEICPSPDFPEIWTRELATIDEGLQGYTHWQAATFLVDGSRHLDLAERLVLRLVELKRNLINAPRTYVDRPFTTDRKVSEYRRQSLAESLDFLGKVLMLEDKPGQAQEAFEEAAIVLSKRKDSNFNQHFIEALLKNKQRHRAMLELDTLMQLGKSNQVLDQYYRKLGRNNVTFAALKEEAAARRKAKLRQELITQVAPNVALFDREGKPVSLQKYAGKTVVIDFWASWCPPCIGGFAAMEQVMKQYKKDNSVVFVFVNVEERSIERALELFSGERRTWNLLLDVQNSAAQQLQIHGLPMGHHSFACAVLTFLLAGIRQSV